MHHEAFPDGPMSPREVGAGERQSSKWLRRLVLNLTATGPIAAAKFSAEERRQRAAARDELNIIERRDFDQLNRRSFSGDDLLRLAGEQPKSPNSPPQDQA